MSLRFLSRVLLPLLLLTSCSRGPRPAQVVENSPQPVKRIALKICADPNNLPFSNDREEGFENQIAKLIASELKLPLEYTWWAQRRGFVRNTLKAGNCDLIMGMPSSMELALTTIPYYRSSYTFVTRKRDALKFTSFDDPKLRQLRIGVQLIGDDFTNSPPAHALTKRNIVDKVRGYRVQGNYSEPYPAKPIIDAVASGEIDVAVVWGPQAGYFARLERIPLDVAPVSPQFDLPYLPFVYDISLGVRREDKAFKEELDEILQRRRADIQSILRRYDVPLVEAMKAQEGK